MRLIVLVVVALGFLVGGCEQKSEPVTQKSAQAELVTKVSAVAQTKTVVDEAVQQVGAVVAAGKETLHQAGAVAEQVVLEVVDTATQDLGAGAVIAQQKATQLVESVQQQASTVQQDGGSLLNSLVDQAVNVTPATDSALVAQTEAAPAVNDLFASVVAVAVDVVSDTNKPADILVIKNAKANVSLTHALHGEKYGCVVCHGEGAPVAFELGKTRAHKLCKDCHRQNNGPVKCSGCHVK